MCRIRLWHGAIQVTGSSTPATPRLFTFHVSAYVRTTVRFKCVCECILAGVCKGVFVSMGLCCPSSTTHPIPSPPFPCATVVYASDHRSSCLHSFVLIAARYKQPSVMKEKRWEERRGEERRDAGLDIEIEVCVKKQDNPFSPAWRFTRRTLLGPLRYSEGGIGSEGVEVGRDFSVILFVYHYIALLNLSRFTWSGPTSDACPPWGCWAAHTRITLLASPLPLSLQCRSQYVSSCDPGYTSGQVSQLR